MRSALLGDVVQFVSGGTPDRSRPEYFRGDIPWITGADIRDDGKIAVRHYISREAVAKSAASVVQPGTLLLVTRTSVGKVARLEVPTAFSQDITAIKPDTALCDVGYVEHFLRSRQPVLVAQARGATIQGVTRQAVASLDLKLPSLNEQRRITAILERVTGVVSFSRRSNELLAAMSPSLFADLFGTPNTWPSRWETSTIGDLATSVQYGTSDRASHEGLFPILRMGNLTYDGRLDLRNLKYLNLNDDEVAKYTVRRGDLLFNRTNSPDLVGKTALYDRDDSMAVAGYLIRLRIAEPHHPAFVWGYLNSRYGKAVLRGMAKTAVNQANISASQLRTIRLPVPPPALQEEYAHRVTASEQQRATTLDRAWRLENLSASLTARAFKGEL